MIRDLVSERDRGDRRCAGEARHARDSSSESRLFTCVTLGSAQLSFCVCAVRPFDCLRHLVANGNPDRLLIGAQDEPIRKLVRHLAGVPLLFIHGSTVIMESPTVTTKDAHADEQAKAQSVIQKEEKRMILEAKKEEKAEANPVNPKAPPPSKKKKKKMGVKVGVSKTSRAEPSAGVASPPSLCAEAEPSPRVPLAV